MFDPLDDLETRSLLIAILKKRRGFGVDLFGLLSIDDLEDGSIRILDQRDPSRSIEDGEQHIHHHVKTAVEHFLAIRRERRLGYDYERRDSSKYDAQVTIDDLH